MNNEELKEELTSYADMVEIIERIEHKFSPSEKYKIDNIKEALRLSAIIVTCETAEEEENAISRLDELLR